MKLKIIKVALPLLMGLAIIAMPKTAAATFWSFDIPDARAGVPADLKQDNIHSYVDSFSGSFDTITQDFTWNSKYTESLLIPGSIPNFFTLVITKGPHVNASPFNQAIIYADLSNNKVLAYEYVLGLGMDTYTDPTRFIGAVNNVLTVNDIAPNMRTVELDMNTLFINNHSPLHSLPADWAGLRFEDNLGLWYHPNLASNINYAGNGSLDTVTFDNKGWVDTTVDGKGIPTNAIPEPTSIILFGIGMLGVAIQRKFKA